MRLAEISEPVSPLRALDSPPPQRTPTPQQEHSSEEADSEASGRSRSRSLTVPRSISRMTRSATRMTRSATRSLRAASVSVQETSVRVASAATRSINKGRTAVQTGKSSATPFLVRQNADSDVRDFASASSQHIKGVRLQFFHFCTASAGLMRVCSCKYYSDTK